MKLQEVKLDDEAKAQLKSAYLHIKKDSVANAEKVRKCIISACKQLIPHPRKHPPDKYKTNNDGNYRAFVLYNLRISYVIKETEIIVLRIRHTSMEPKDY